MKVVKGKDKKETPKSRSKSPSRSKRETSRSGSKSPARGKSPGRKIRDSPVSDSSSPLKQTRRSRSRSPARTTNAVKTETLAGSTRLSETSNQKKSVVKQSPANSKMSDMTFDILREAKVTRSSMRFLTNEFSSGLVQRKVEPIQQTKTEDSKPVTKSSTCILNRMLSCFAPVLSFILSLILLAALITVGVVTTLACNLKSCKIESLPSIPKNIASFFDWRIAALVGGWMLLQLVLAWIPLGWVRYWYDTNPPVIYRCNGFISAVVLKCIFIGLYYYKQPVFRYISTQFIPLVAVFIVLTALLSLVLFIRNRSGGFSGLVYGTSVLLQIWPLRNKTYPVNVKIFLVVHMAILGWATLNGIVGFEAYQTNKLSPAFVCVFIMQSIFIIDFLLFQASLSHSLLMRHDTVGFIFLFMCLVFVPFVNNIHLRYLLSQPSNTTECPYVLLSIAATLFFIGYLISRQANFVKDRFRENRIRLGIYEEIPGDPMHFQRPLIASGLWGLCRHPNYFGCLLMAIGWSLPCGVTNPITYLYILHTLILFAIRAHRDNELCCEKHGQMQWGRYCQQVRSRFIPFIY